MSQLTIRNFGADFEKVLGAVATERGWSLNRAAVFLMRKGAGLEAKAGAQPVGNALDEFIGSWSVAESKAFDKRVATVFETVDAEVWQ